MTGRRISGDTPKSITRHGVESVTDVEDVQKPLHEMYKDVSDRIQTWRWRAIDLQTAATNIIEPKFVVGDFFVV